MSTLHTPPAPAPRPAPLDLGLGTRRPADRPVLVAAGVAAALTDLAVRSGVAGLAGTVLVVAVVVGLLATGRLDNPQARALAAGATVFGAFLTLRASPWLLPLDVLACAGLLVLAASLAEGGTVLDLAFPDVAVRAAHAAAHGLAAPAFLAAPGGGRRPSALLRGIALAVPLLAVLGLLLASADAVFAGFFDWWSPATLLAHAALLAVGAWGMGGLLRLSSAEPPPSTPPLLTARVGAVEATVVLGSLVALFTAFAAAQLVALAGGGDHVLRTAGLTYAEYARSGFFQLLAVAAITLVALVGLRGAARPGGVAEERRLTVLAEAVVALTLVIVAVAIRRLALYEHAFGLTMLRLYSTVFAAWIGVVMALLGCAIAGLGRHRAWLAAAAAGAGLALLLGLNVVNPETVVARHNLARGARTQRVDPGYLAALSDDAVPVLVAGLDRLAESARTDVSAAVCAGQEPRFSGWWATNTARRRAVEARRRVCPVRR